jgi:drug/metabolite transporter (DMT)-like permease
LLVAVGAMSWAGPLVRFTTAPPLVIAAWRLNLAVVVIGALLLFRRPLPRLRLTGREWALACAAGTLLAAHFWSWITALEMTSIANAAVLVSMQPVFVAVLSALLLAERASGRQWIGIGVAVVGAAVIGLANLNGGGPEAGGRASLLGDLLALAGAVFAAGYFVIGRRLRRDFDLLVYIGLIYGIAAVVLTAAVLLSPGVALTGYPRGDWLVFIALALGPMMIGHTGVNYALRYLPAFVANLALLGEPIGAIIIAWLLPAIGEVPTPAVIVGGILIAGGLVFGVQGGAAQE